MSEPQPAILKSTGEMPVATRDENIQPAVSSVKEIPSQPATPADRSGDDHAFEEEIARKTRRSLLVGGVAAVIGAGAWEWLRTRRMDEGIQWPLRIALRANEQLTRDYFRPARLAPTFSAADIGDLRENGTAGLDDDVDPNWKLAVQGAGDSPVSLSIDAIKALPKIEMITEFKCIEGWSTIMKWSGARLSDFIAKYGPRNLDPESYVSMETPDKGYYVGLEMACAMHPQTLLAYEMNGEPLPDEHGGPLRLVTPLKYGVKNIKRIGQIAFTDQRPRDYWAERGYDWYAGF
jgi:DMSO/TMAO reductase YedYZ molybdopterin-dependent catalytic subunit